MVLEQEDITAEFARKCKADPRQSEAIVAIDLLQRVIRESSVSTVQGLHNVLNNAITQMTDTGRNYLCVKSACELFQRFITLTVAEAPDEFEHCKKSIQERANLFVNKISSCKQQIASNFLNLLPHGGACVLVHSYSRIVLNALAEANRKLGEQQMQLHCYVTHSSPHESGRLMTKELAKLRIPCTLIPDLAIAYLMPKISLVLMGAKAVVESGGILNEFGSSTVAMIAHASGKPVYVLAESFKFIRAFPLDQQHIPEEFKSTLDSSPDCSPLLRELRLTGSSSGSEFDDDDGADSDDFAEMHSTWETVRKLRAPVIERTMPSIDYISPYYISYLVTDLGVLTPSVVSDELIKLYL